MQLPGSTQENTCVFDIESTAELVRLVAQHRVLAHFTDGVLPEIADPSRIQHTLDVACGPGGWALELAYLYPDMEVVGFDISNTMIGYARLQAKQLDLDNVDFSVMNALAPLDFPDGSFDLVNAKSLVEFMPKDGWIHLLREGMRILRPGGIMRMTESEIGFSNAPAHEHLCGLYIRTMSEASRCFSPDERHLGIIPMLAPFLRKAGFQHVQQTAHVVDYSSGADNHEAWCQDLLLKMKLIIPFIVEMGLAPQEALLRAWQRMQEELYSPHFCATWMYVTAWGYRP